MGSAPSRTRVHQASQYPTHSAKSRTSTSVVIYPTRNPSSPVYPSRPPPSTLFPIRPVLSSPSSVVDHHHQSSSANQLTSYANIWENNGKVSFNSNSSLFSELHNSMFFIAIQFFRSRFVSITFIGHEQSCVHS